MRNWYRILALVLMAALMLGGTLSATAEEVLYRSTPAELDYENAVYGGTLRVGNRFSGVSNIGYPFTMANNSNWEWFNACPALESLVRYDTVGNMIPWLAESWDVDPDGLTVTVKLVPGVKFHDGTDFNAEALIWNWQQYTANGNGALNTVESYEALDEVTAVAHLSSWDSAIQENLLYTCGWVISPSATEANGADWAAANPVGTGPFVFEEWIRDVGVYYNRNENYWREGQPYLDRVEMCIYSDVTALGAALTTGQVDVVMPADATVALTWANAGGVTETYFNVQPTAHCVMMPSNNPDLPFYDVRVRQAIAYAIDSEAIANLMSEQGGDYQAAFQIAVPGSYSYDDTIEGYHYDPEKAKELLAEAGYADGFTCPGYVIASNNLLRQCADIVAAYLAEVGITVQNQNNDMALISEMTAGTGKQLDGIVWLCTAISANTTVAYAKSFTEEGNTYASVTAKPDDMTKAIEDARAAKTDEELAEACKAMVRSNYENALILPVALQANGQCVTDYVHNFNFVRGSQFDWEPEGVWMDPQ